MYERRIQRGIAWLEGKHAKVDLDKVNLDLLELADWDKCILGQLLGGVKCTRLINAEPEWAERHGFHLDNPEENDSGSAWALLTNEWVRILRARRAARNSDSEDGQ